MNEESTSQEIIDEVTAEQDKKFDVKAVEEKVYKDIEKETKKIVKNLK